MQDKFAESKSFELMAPLIILGSELALKEYLLYAKENHRIPERVDSFDGPTEAISKISDPQKIGILAELLQIAMEPSFRDGDFFTLRSGVANALVNCGKEKPEAVIAVFERQIALEKHDLAAAAHQIFDRRDHNEQRQQHTDDLHQHHKAHNNSQHDVHMDHSGAFPVDGLLFLAGFFFKRRFDDQRHRQQRQRTGQNAGPHRGVFLRRRSNGITTGFIKDISG